MTKLTEVCMACGKTVGWGVLVDAGNIMACKECIELGVKQVGLAKLGTEVYNLLRLGFLKAESAGSDRAIKAATTKYNKAVATNPEFARVESIRLNGGTDRNIQDLGERTIITPDSLLGNVLVPVAGDRTVTGHALNKSQGFGLLDDVNIKGGPRFPIEHQDKGLGWASMEGAAKQKQKNFDLAARETDNPNVVGVYNAMGDEANNFATPIADVIIQQLSGNKIPKAVVSEFDDVIRQANPNWVGINHPEARAQLMGIDGYPQKGAGALRSRFTKLAGMAKYRDKGFPSRERIRDDVVEPALLNARRGDSGFTMFDAVPDGKVTPFAENPSYDTGILGQFRGGLTESVPAEVMFPDVFSELSKKINKAGNTLSRGEILGSLVMDPKLYQRADQKWLDNIAGYLEKNQGKLGASLPAVAVSMLGAGVSDDAEAGVVSSVAKGILDMSTPARMARAKEQGYNVDDVTYRWLSEDYPDNKLPTNSRYKFGDAIYSSPEPSYGQAYANEMSSNPVAYPMVARGKIANKDDAIRAEKILIEEGRKPKDYTQTMNAINQQLKTEGFTGLDYAGERMMFDEDTSRSIFAAFDPTKASSSNILASNPAALAGAGILGLGAAAQSNDTYADDSPSNLAKLRNDDVGGYQAPSNEFLAKAAMSANSLNDKGVDDPLMQFIAPRMPSELMNKIAYNDERGLIDRIKAAAGLLGLY